MNPVIEPLFSASNSPEESVLRILKDYFPDTEVLDQIPFLKVDKEKIFECEAEGTEENDVIGELIDRRYLIHLRVVKVAPSQYNFELKHIELSSKDDNINNT